MIRVLGAEPYEKVRELCHKKDVSHPRLKPGACHKANAQADQPQ